MKGLSLHGPKLPNRDVRYLVAVGGRPEMAQTVQFGRESNHSRASVGVLLLEPTRTNGL
jgi:hypothetical protein